MPNVTRGIKTKIQLDGEQEFKQAISGINSGIGVLDSELRKLKAQYEDNANSVEFLTKQGDILERKYYSQQEKVEEYRKELDKLKAAYGESSTEVMNMERKLNDAEAQLYKTENAIKKNNEAIEDANKGIFDFLGEAKGLGDLLDSVGSKFGVSIPDGVKGSLNGFAQFSAVGVASVMGVVAAVKALIDAEKALIQLTTEAASEADNILTMSQITGLDTDTIQEMQYASELIDVSFETIQGSMTKMKRNMDSARDGNEKLTESFSKLGVSITNADGTLRNSEDVFYDCVDALGEIENYTERDALSMEIFGKSAQDLNPLIIQGTDTLKAYAEEAHEVSAVMNEEELAALGAVDDAYQRLQETQDAVKQQIAIEMAPAVEKFYTEWAEFTRQAVDALVESGILEYMGNLLEAVAGLFEPLASLIEAVLPALKIALAGVAGIISLIADSVNVIVGLLTFDFDKVATALGANTSKGQLSNYQKTKYNYAGYDTTYSEEAGGYVGNYYNASGTENFEGGLTWVGENGPELLSLPSGSSISTAQDSRNYGTSNYYITIDAKNVKEFNDVVRIAKNSRRTSRMRA